MGYIFVWMPEPLKQIAIGQISLIFSCLFYLFWWAIAFYPNASRKRKIAGNLPLLCLWISAGYGLYYISRGMYTICAFGTGYVLVKPVVSALVTGAIATLAIAGIITYLGLYFVTTKLFKRKLTAELALIVAWAVLEMMVFETLSISGLGAWNVALPCLVTMAVATFVALVCYLIYYRLERPALRFFSGLVPMGVDAVAMTILTYLFVP